MSFAEFDAFREDVEKRHWEEFDALQKQKESFSQPRGPDERTNQALAGLNQASKNLAEKQNISTSKHKTSTPPIRCWGKTNA